jgi:LmbE family N-acetylglucosaminyl deacetylase
MKQFIANRPLFALALFIFSPILSVAADAPAPPIVFSADDRVLILAPHPDDEILGAGGVIQRALAAQAQVKIVFLTYGDFNMWSFTVFKHRPVFFPSGMRAMGEVRRKEAIDAAAVLGLDKSDLTFLGYPDHGTLSMWCFNWNAAKPFRSGTTKARGVPYKDAYHVNAPYAGNSIVDDMKQILTDYKPTQIFVTNAADENPDHRAIYLFARVALWDLEKTISPALHPFLIHYRFRHWPVPQGYHPQAPLTPPEALARDIAWVSFPLTAPEIALKFKALQKHATQFRYSGKYLSSFVRANELFGNYEPVHLTENKKIALDEDEVQKKTDLPATYTEEEKDAFVDLDQRTVDIEDGKLVISTSYRRPFKNKFRFSLYAFGYRPDHPFADMPKIRIIVSGRNKQGVFNGRIKLRDSGVQIIRVPNLLTVKVPLSLLGDPARLLTGVQTSLEETPLDVMSWREIYLK